MSSAAMNWAFEKIVPHLRDQVEKLVILRLADRADPAGECWPGHNRTAADLNVSLRSVQAAIQKLSEIGLLVLVKRPGTSSTIKLQLDSVVPAAIAAAGKKKKKKKLKKGGEAISLPPDASRGEASSLKGCNQFTSGGEATSPESPIESKKEPPPQAEEKTVVVVVDEIHWPLGLSAEQIRASSEALLAAAPSRRQSLVDELAGAMARSGPKVDNPPGWMRGLLKRELGGGALLELAPSIASARAARAAAQAREEGGTITIAPRPLPSPSGPASLLQLAGRAAAREQLATLKRQTPQAA